MQEPQAVVHASSLTGTVGLALVIPAYHPHTILVDLVQALLHNDWETIVVVDDGSAPESEFIFAQLSRLPRVEVLRHAVNLGKGAALKTAIQFALVRCPRISGVLTVDADGQHDPDDVRRVAERFREDPRSLVLGVRDFRGAVPLRSSLGNRVTRHVFRAAVGYSVTDSQTGLRAVPRSFAARLLGVEACGYEFEMEMLILAKRLEFSVVEQPIRTIYRPGNPTSHFRPVRDSMRIYFVLLRFAVIAVLSAIVDNLAFLALFRLGGHLLPAQIGARVTSLLFNYPAVRSRVFCSDERHWVLLPRYLFLAGINVSLSYWGVRLLIATGFTVMWAKLLADGLLFVFSFAVQRGVIFVKRSVLKKTL